MFFEKEIKMSCKKGWIEVITGSMFSGKTEELIRRINRAKIAKQKVEIFKPSIDTRYSNAEVVSHDTNRISSTPVNNPRNILLRATDTNVVAIDEAQFFDDSLINVCNELANSGIRVIVAGLDMDYLGTPFGPIPKLMAIAEHITKVHAICVKCGELAHFSHRISTNDDLVLLGESKEYEPLCRSCYSKVNNTHL